MIRTSASTPDLTISDEDLRWVASQFSLQLDDARRKILSCVESRDIRACPGSGKTTLVVAKLAILARKWKSSTSGICVLSHTNVAQREIRNRFASCPALESLDHYPHFVGTIQSFIDSFLGIPGAIAKFHVRPQVIDDDRCGIEMAHEFRSTSLYDNARVTLTKKFQGSDHMTIADYLSALRWYGQQLDLRAKSGKELPYNANTNTFVELRKLKATVSKRGYFCFSDLTALAQSYLQGYPLIKEHLSRRFPLVIVDEAQDTPATQSALLDQVFHGQSVHQRIGDDRQAIFSNDSPEDETSAFPRTPFLTMPTSMRLSSRTAKLAQGICFPERETLGGNSIRSDGRHSIFLFDTSSIKLVLPTFAQLVAEDVGVNFPSREVRAVAGSAKKAESAHKFPTGLADYWDGFRQTRDAAKHRLKTFSGYVEAAAANIRHAGCTKGAVSYLAYATARLLRLQNAPYDREVLRSDRLLTYFAEHEPSLHRQLRMTISAILRVLTSRGDVIADDATYRPLIDFVVQHTGGQLTRQAQAFVEAGGSNSQDSILTQTSAENIFEYPAAGGTVNVQVGTIHSVKGETVSAVLVMESFINSHHFKKLIEKRFLYGTPAMRDPGVQVRNHLKRTFVGMTRPTRLLCLAMPRSHVDDDGRHELNALGWTLVDL